MIIPIRCFTCGEVLADKWIPYITEVQNQKNKIEKELDATKEILDLQYIDVTKTKGEKSFLFESVYKSQMLFSKIEF